MDEHLGPGVCARLTGLSISQLRRYDRLGYLVPDEVEPATGRRWYRRSRIAQGRLLGGLVASGMPVAAAARAADQGDGAAVRGHLDVVDAALTAIHATLPPSTGRAVRWRTPAVMAVLFHPDEETAPDALTAALRARAHLARDLGCGVDELPGHGRPERGFPQGPLVVVGMPDMMMGHLPGPARLLTTLLPWDPRAGAVIPDGWVPEPLGGGAWALSDLAEAERGADPATLARVVGEVVDVVQREERYLWSSLLVAYDPGVTTGTVATACRPLFR